MRVERKGKWRCETARPARELNCHCPPSPAGPVNVAVRRQPNVVATDRFRRRHCAFVRRAGAVPAYRQHRQSQSIARDRLGGDKDRYVTAPRTTSRPRHYLATRPGLSFIHRHRRQKQQYITSLRARAGYAGQQRRRPNRLPSRRISLTSPASRERRMVTVATGSRPAKQNEVSRLVVRPLLRKVWGRAATIASREGGDQYTPKRSPPPSTMASEATEAAPPDET